MFLGEFSTGQTADFLFTSVSSGEPTAYLSGGIEVYKTTSATRSTEGVTLTSTFDSITGLNHCQIIMTNAFYDPGEKYHVILSTGTVGGTTVGGYAIANFNIRYGLLDNVADGTTALSTDLADAQTDLDTLTTDVEQLTSSSSRLEADSTSNLAALTSLTSSVEILGFFYLYFFVTFK